MVRYLSHTLQEHVPKPNLKPKPNPNLKPNPTRPPH